MKNRFKFSGKKRLFVLGFTTLASILTIVLGTVFYLAQPGVMKKSSEYGSGTEFLVSIKSGQDVKSSNIANKVAQDVQNRLDPLGINGVRATSEIYGDSADIHVSYPGITTSQQRYDVEQLIIHKPELILTDCYGNPLFTEKGTFNTSLSGDPKKFLPFDGHDTIEDLLYRDAGNIDNGVNSLVPISPDGSQVVKNSEGTNEGVKVKLTSTQAASQWGLASKYISALPKGKNELFAWLDPQIMYTKIYNYFKNDPDVMKAKNNLNEFIRVGQNENNALRKYTVDVGQYYVSQAPMSQLSADNSFTLSGNFNPNKANEISRKINYGISNYSLSTDLTLQDLGPKYGKNAFKMTLIAGLVIFTIIAIVLIVNYGLLGALSTISLALLIFLTILMFTVMRGEYSPASIAALVVGIGMSIDVIVVTFERLKAELYSGATLKKAFRLSRRKSFFSIFDSNLAVMIVAVTLFFFGAKTIINLPVMLILAIIFTMVMMLIITRWLSNILIDTNWVKNNKRLIGLKPKFDVKVQNKIDAFNFTKNSKWFSLSSFGIMIAGFIVFATFAIINQSFALGFNLSQDFRGGVSVTAQVNDATRSIYLVRQILLSSPFDFDPSYIHIYGNELSANTMQHLSDADLQLLKQQIGNVAGFNFAVFRTTTFLAQKITLDALYAVLGAIGFVAIYTFVRFKWTYSIAIILALFNDALMVVLIFVILRIQIQPTIVVSILAAIAYSINDKVITFDRIREKMAVHTHVIDKKEITNTVNIAIKEVIKRFMITSSVILVSVILLMVIGQGVKLSYGIAMVAGIITSFISSIFMSTWIWIRLETYRQKRIMAREKNGFWNVRGTEEQTIQGINDFTA